MPCYPNCSEVNRTNVSFPQTLFEHLAGTSPLQVPPQKLSFSLPDGAIQGKHQHDNTLRHTWPRLGLKGLAFYVLKKSSVVCIHWGDKNLHPITGFLPGNYFSTKDTLGLGAGQPHSRSWPGDFISSAAVTQKCSHSRNTGNFPIIKS